MIQPKIIDDKTLPFAKQSRTNPPTLSEVMVKEFSVGVKPEGSLLVEFLDAACDNKYKLSLNASQVLRLKDRIRKALSTCEGIDEIVKNNKNTAHHRLYLGDDELIINYPNHGVSGETFVFDPVESIHGSSNRCHGCNRFNAHLMLTFTTNKKNVSSNFPKKEHLSVVFLDVFFTKKMINEFLQKVEEVVA